MFCSESAHHAMAGTGITLEMSGAVHVRAPWPIALTLNATRLGRIVDDIIGVG